MIKITFTSQMPQEILLLATASEAAEIVVEKKGQYRKVIAVKESREETGAEIANLVKEGSAQTLVFDARSLGEHVLDLLTGITLSSWRFEKYKSVKKGPSLEKIVVVCNDPEGLEMKFRPMKCTLQGVIYARELTSEPPNVFYPEAYAERLKELEEYGIEVEILNKSQLETIGMTALLAASQGGARPPVVAILTWKGTNDKEPPVLLVGKGVCFDSGGICLKSTANQQDMKWDKAGAGVVAGVLKTLALTKSAAHVVGIVGLMENMPDGSAAKVGDVIQTMSGQTIEIANTDAEGRLVLADCIWYGQERFSPKTVIDLGTLTIETMASLGTRYAGLYSNDPGLTERLKKAAERTGDLVWELPIGPYFAKQIESDVADIKNVGIDLCGDNGAAAEFLRCFVKKGVSWAHIDIAGVSWTKEDLPLAAKGVTGFGVRLLDDFLK